MMMFKTTLRVLVAVILIVPSIPVFYFTTSLFTLIFFLSFFRLCEAVFYWLLSDKEKVKDCMFDVGTSLLLLKLPFLFWYRFVINDRPFELLK